MKLSHNALLVLGAVAALYLYSRFGGPQGSTPQTVDDPDAGSFDPGDIVSDVYAETVGTVLSTFSAQAPSSNCIALIQEHEGCRLAAYFDVKGYSIGWGHFGVAEGTTWTQAQCDAQLQTDAAAAGASVSKYITVSLNQNQFDALVDFVYSLGAGALAGSTLRKILNQGNYDGVPAELVKWVNVAGVPSQAILTRRLAEVNTWNTPSDALDAPDSDGTALVPFTPSDSSSTVLAAGTDSSDGISGTAFDLSGVSDADGTDLFDEFLGGGE